MRTMRSYQEHLEGAPDARRAAGALQPEACLAGLALHLEPRDLLSAAVPDARLALAGGATPEHVVTSDLKALPFETVSGGSPARALGQAMARRATAPGSATVCWLDTANLEAGETFDLLRAARSLTLPLVFVALRRARAGDPALQTGRPAEAQSDFVLRARSLGIEATATRGCDLFSVHHTAGEALARARAGRGPSILEAVHTGADPIEMFRAKTLDADLLVRDDFSRLDWQVGKALDEAFTAARRLHAAGHTSGLAPIAGGIA